MIIEIKYILYGVYTTGTLDTKFLIYIFFLNHLYS